MTRIDQALDIAHRLKRFTWRDLEREIKLDYAACKRVIQRMRDRGLIRAIVPSVGGGNYVTREMHLAVYEPVPNPPQQAVRPRGRPPKARAAPVRRVASVWDLAQ